MPKYKSIFKYEKEDEIFLEKLRKKYTKETMLTVVCDFWAGPDSCDANTTNPPRQTVIPTTIEDRVADHKLRTLLSEEILKYYDPEVEKEWDEDDEKEHRDTFTLRIEDGQPRGNLKKILSKVDKRTVERTLLALPKKYKMVIGWYNENKYSIT